MQMNQLCTVYKKEQWNKFLHAYFIHFVLNRLAVDNLKTHILNLIHPIRKRGFCPFANFFFFKKPSKFLLNRVSTALCNIF